MSGVVGKGRKYEGRRIVVRIPDELVATIDRYAKTYGVSRAAMIRRLLREVTK